MSRWCDWYACPKDLLDRFFYAAEVTDVHGDGLADEAVAELLNELYPVRRTLLHHNINHTWEEIHRVLTDDFTPHLDFDRGQYPLRLCIHGGEWLLVGRRTMTLVAADEVPALCRALEAIDEGWMREKLRGCGRSSWLRRVWEEFCPLREFYLKVEKANLPVICTISH
jgi:hypothetical protein